MKAPAAISVRVWLVQNGYDDIAAKIQKLIVRWKKQGKTTRRNWWDTLAGTEKGEPIEVDGITFPILCCARVRKGWSEIPSCIRRRSGEQALPVKKGGRWPSGSAKKNQ